MTRVALALGLALGRVDDGGTLAPVARAKARPKLARPNPTAPPSAPEPIAPVVTERPHVERDREPSDWPDAYAVDKEIHDDARQNNVWRPKVAAFLCAASDQHRRDEEDRYLRAAMVVSSWEPADRVSGARFRAAAGLIQAAVDMIFGGDDDAVSGRTLDDGEAVARLNDAADVARGSPKARGARMVGFVNAVERLPSVRLDLHFPDAIAWAIEFWDPALERIPTERWIEVRAALLAERKSKAKTGAGHRGAVFYAAQLAVEANAFGMGEDSATPGADNGYAAKCARALGRLKKERSIARE